VNVLDQAIGLPATPSSVRPKESASRAHPLSLEVPVGVQGSRRVMSVPGQPERLEQFSEETRTVIVFPQGAVIRLSAAVAPGQMLVVANRKSQQEVLCRVVNVKNHPNVKGYVEIEFTQPTNGFWGVYFPQDALKSPGGEGGSVATMEGTPKVRPIVPTLTSTSASIPASIQNSSAASPATRPKAPVVPVSPDDFWGSSFPTEVIAPAAQILPQSSIAEPTLSAAPNGSALSEVQSFDVAEVPAPSVAPPSPETPPESVDVVAPRAEDISEVVPPPSVDIASSSVFAQPLKPALEPVVTSSDPWGTDSAVELPPVVITSSPMSGNGGFTSSQGLATIAEEIHKVKDEEAIKLAPLAGTSAISEAATSISSAASPSFSEPADWEDLGGAEGRIESSLADSPLSSVPDLLGSPEEESAPSAAGRAHSSSRTMVWVGVAAVALFVVGAAGFFFSHRGSAKSAAPPDSAPVAAPSTQASPAPPSVQQDAPAASDSGSVAPQPSQPPSPIVVKPQSQAPKEAANSTAMAKTSETASPELPAKKPAWAGHIQNGKLLGHAGHSAKANVEDALPDLTGATSNAPVAAIAGVLPGTANGLPALPPAPADAAPLRVGGRMKEPRLTTKVLPTYPPAARQLGLEGKIVIDAIVDAAGNVTNMKVVSGPPLLRRSALDAVGQWKYQPSYLDDKPVAVQMFITVEFHLR
jgi:TonB family protein